LLFGVTGWNGDIISAQGIRNNSDAADGQNDKKPDVTPDSAPQLRAYHDHHKPYFDMLQQHKLKPVNRSHEVVCEE